MTSGSNRPQSDDDGVTNWDEPAIITAGGTALRFLIGRALAWLCVVTGCTFTFLVILSPLWPWASAFNHSWRGDALFCAVIVSWAGAVFLLREDGR